MSAILKSFNVRLSRKQTAEIRKQIEAVGNRTVYNIAVQCVTRQGPFALEHGVLNIAVLSKECGEAISAVLASHRPQQ